MQRLNEGDIVKNRFSILSLELTHMLPRTIFHDLQSRTKYRTVIVESFVIDLPLKRAKAKAKALLKSLGQWQKS